MSARIEFSNGVVGTYRPIQCAPVRRIDVPDGVIEVPLTLTVRQALELKREWEARYDWFKASSHG